MRHHPEVQMSDFFVHPTAVIDDGCTIGAGTKIWHFTHVMAGARLGRGCNVGQNCFIDRNVDIGDNVKIQNNVSVYTGCHIADHVFLGPSCVFTNVTTPRSAFPRNDPQRDYVETWVRRGASVGANATIRCGVELGEWCLIGSGAVVTHDVPVHAVMVGVPAQQTGWACLCAAVLRRRDSDSRWVCPEANCGREYEIKASRIGLVHTPDHARPMLSLD
jgi:UDP-2-acetamido-3-amino-2,3-dideoxy-glucuronate N-acetyltransferase